MRFFIDSGTPDVLEIGVGVLLPHLLEFVDLMERDLSSSKLLLLRRSLDEPREELPIVDDG